MRAKTLLTGLFLISYAVFCLKKKKVLSQKGGATVPREQILAATMALPAGTLLRAQDVTWRAVGETEPDQIVRPNAAAVQAQPEIAEETMASVYGAVLRH